MSAQSFEGAHMGRVYIRVFIEVGMGVVDVYVVLWNSKQGSYYGWTKGSRILKIIKSLIFRYYDWMKGNRILQIIKSLIFPFFGCLNGALQVECKGVFCGLCKCWISNRQPFSMKYALYYYDIIVTRSLEQRGAALHCTRSRSPWRTRGRGDDGNWETYMHRILFVYIQDRSRRGCKAQSCMHRIDSFGLYVAAADSDPIDALSASVRAIYNPSGPNSLPSSPQPAATRLHQLVGPSEPRHDPWLPPRISSTAA